jgi:hypothetical protein
VDNGKQSGAEMATEPTNGDTRLILHRIGQVEKQIVKLRSDLESTVLAGDERVRALEINQAVLTKAQADCSKLVCGELKTLKTDIKRNDIVGSVLGAIGAWIAAVLTFFGLNR